MTTKREFEFKSKLWVDPPNGHIYGFPKIFPENLDPRNDDDLKILLTSHGYPEKDLNLALRHSRWFGNLDRIIT